MKLGVRTRLVLVSVGLIVVSVLAADAYLSRALAHTVTDRVRAELSILLAVAEPEVSAAKFSMDGADAQESWTKVAVDLGARSRTRITIIRADGLVLGDSEVPRADLASVENHGHRPEVEQALASGHGNAVRDSTTVHQQMMYAAVPFANGAGVLRASVPLRDVDDAIAAVRWLLFGASLVALGVTIIVSFGAAQRLSRVVRQLTAAAARMAKGDLDARTRVTGADELGELGQTLDHLAGSLDDSLRALRAERDRIGGILEAMQEGVLVLDDERRVVLVNPALRAMLLLPADIVGRRLLEVLRHAELQEILDKVDRLPGPASGELEVAGVKPRRLLAQADSLPAGLFVVFFDVTELRRLESLRRDFVANVSHELRTPVTAVRSAAETLRSAAVKDPAAAPRFLDIIERNAERLQDLVEDLLDLSRIESRQYHLHPEGVDLAPLLARSAGLMRERAEKKSIKLELDVPADLPAARADRRALEQVLANLVENAVKYSGKGATVTLAAKPSGERIAVSIVDNGPGIEARHLPRLFERFYRVDAGRSRDQGGTGLGLSIVKHLVEAMSGHVSVESTPGHGTTFTFTLPRA